MERSGGVWVGLETAREKKASARGDAERGGEISQGGGGTVGPGRLSAVRGPAGSRQASARFLQMGPCLCLHSTHTLLTFPPDPRWVANPIRQFVRPLSAKSVLDTAAWISEAWGGCHAGPAAFTAVSAVTCPAKRCLVVLTVLESHTSHNHTAGAGRWVAVHGAGGGQARGATWRVPVGWEAGSLSALMLWLPLHIPHEQGERKTSPEDLHMAAEWIPSPSVHRSIGKKKITVLLVFPPVNVAM